MRVHQIQKAGTATELSSRSDPLCSDTCVGGLDRADRVTCTGRRLERGQWVTPRVARCTQYLLQLL